MKIFQILIPIYNDWESLNTLLFKIFSSNKNSGCKFNVLIIDDYSSEKNNKNLSPVFANEIEILRNEKNIGHARSIAKGIEYLKKNKEFDFLIVMDGDGEDRPEEISELVHKSLNNPNKTITANRVKRSEGLFFKFLYECHKILVFLFTGKFIKFGNYVSIPYSQLSLIFDKNDLSISFSGTVEKYIFNKDFINSFRGLRYQGPTKMSFLQLILHSFRIISVFKFNFFFRSLVFSSAIGILLFFFPNTFFNYFFFFAIMITIILNLIFFYIFHYYSKT